MVIHREVNQRERKRYHMISLTGGIYQSIQMNYYTKQKQTHKLQKPTSAYQKEVRKSDKLRLLH